MSRSILFVLSLFVSGCSSCRAPKSGILKDFPKMDEFEVCELTGGFVGEGFNVYADVCENQEYYLGRYIYAANEREDFLALLQVKKLPNDNFQCSIWFDSGFLRNEDHLPNGTFEKTIDNRPCSLEDFQSEDSFLGKETKRVGELIRKIQRSKEPARQVSGIFIPTHNYVWV